MQVQGAAGPPEGDGAALRWLEAVPGTRVTSPFGDRRDPFTGRRSHHESVDLAAREGAPVRAVAAGVVRVATALDETQPERGTLVVIDHAEGYQSLCAHLRDLALTAGAMVVAGQVVGHLGSTGVVTGPRVHLEIRHAGEPGDPLALLGDWPAASTTPTAAAGGATSAPGLCRRVLSGSASCSSSTWCRQCRPEP